MSRHAATRGPAATTTTVTLAVLLAGLTAGIPAALYGLTRDWDVTGRTILLAAVIVATALDLLWIASIVRRLYGSYRGQS